MFVVMTMHVVTAIPVSEEIRSYGSVERVDYADAYRIPASGAESRDAEEWLRHIFESLPTVSRRGLRFGWRLITARLGPYPSPGHVLGWTIEDSQPGCARIALTGSIGVRANLVLRTEATTLTIATLLEHRRTTGRIMWTFVRPIHERILRALLSRATSRPLDQYGRRRGR
jgi:hypothetical protein